MSRTATTKFLRGFTTDIRHGKHTQDRLRELLRHTAQPVAVVTAKMPSKSTPHPYHGATLSSFASIAMHPYPIISFALRIPSRMADILKVAQPDHPSHMVVNLLSAEQEAAAVKFSRADLYPEPFSSVSYSLSDEGHPILEGTLGSLSCKLVSNPIPLHDLDYLGGGCNERQAVEPESGLVSELFIARVLRVETLDQKDADEDDPRTLPLLYHRRGYTSCHPASRPKSN
ncbi:hypothetical protein D9615_002202 [Tricholomella constricta]|uniref:Flavin reductase like domain-containing protein n=1 Tax=Tricholomella constricta TaxID=117010 RepID=A0A8H5M9L7_9AGAR|nr:hypothetical protein D9615_002202 [Tricholomella constricta]